MNDLTLRQLFESSADLSEGFIDRSTLVEKSISYSEIFKEADRLAARLKQLSLRSRFIAAIWMEPSYYCYQAFMAVVLANGIPVPLHAFQKAEEILLILDRLECEILLISPAFAEKLNELKEGGRFKQRLWKGTYFVDGERLSEMDNLKFSETMLERAHRAYTPPKETAVIFLSSGSTGTPKGVMLSEQNILANMVSIQQYLQLSKRGRMLISKSFGYSSTITGEWLLALSIGMTICLTDKLFHPYQLIQAIRDFKATFVCTVPSTMITLIKSSKWKPAELKSLTKLIIVGAAMPPEMLLRLHELLPWVEIMPCYGLTEASPRVTYLPSDQLTIKPGSAGIPVHGVQVAIYKNDQLVQSGMEGEVIVNGRNVMLGYYHDADKTRTTKRNYGLCTGDRGYLDQEGYLYITGRMDNAINVAGTLIQAELLENLLSNHPAVLECGVTGMADHIWGQRPIAFVVAASSEVDAARLANQLHVYCLAHLHSTQRPKEIVVTSQLPKTSSGKLDRTALNLLIKEWEHGTTQAFRDSKNDHQNHSRAK